MQGTLSLGKKPFVYDKRDLRYEDVRPKATAPALPKVPFGWGRGMDFPYWGMLGNGPVDPEDASLPAEWTAAQGGAGDCTIADPCHAERMNAHDSGNPLPTFNAKCAIDQYIDLTGRDGAAYDPVSGNNDNGLEPRNVLKYRQQEGLLDADGNRHKIGIYVQLEPGNWSHLQEACWLFPGITIGMLVTQAQMDAANANKTWTYVPSSEQLGGHDVLIVGRPMPGLWTIISWGQRFVMTAQLISQQVDEMWAYIDLSRISKVTGKTYNGYQDVDLEEYITVVGNTAN